MSGPGDGPQLAPVSAPAAPDPTGAETATRAGLHAGRKLFENLLPSRRARMVGWYDPGVLAQSAWLMTVANIFGRHSDSRLIEALASQPQREFRFDADRDSGEFWLGMGTTPRSTAQSTTARLIENTRSMTYELNPPVLHELGLGAGLEWLAEQMYKREGVIVQFEDDGQPRSLEKEINILLFNAVRELLINVAKHARADNVKISLQSDQAGVRICVEDNGIGFIVPGTGFPASKSNSFGLFSIKERLNYVGGHLDIKTAPGKGTRITLHIPHKQS